MSFMGEMVSLSALNIEDRPAGYVAAGWPPGETLVSAERVPADRRGRDEERMIIYLFVLYDIFMEPCRLVAFPVSALHNILQLGDLKSAT